MKAILVAIAVITLSPLIVIAIVLASLIFGVLNLIDDDTHNLH